MTDRPEVNFINSQDAFRVPSYIRNGIRQAIEATLDYEGVDRPVCVDVTFTDNEGIKELNREYRDIDRETDVLSFPTYESKDELMADDEPECLLGDIVISVEKARAQAEEYGHSVKREFVFLATHSMLHLLGYDHVTSPEDEKLMFGKQDEILKNINVNR